MEETKKYEVIYADPPWRYDFSNSKNRDIENHYDTMDLEDIKKIPVKDMSADDCVLFMWATAPKLTEAFEVINAWGFEYKTHMIWDKLLVGMGYWFRGQHELLMVATKGNPKCPAPKDRYKSVYQQKRTEHSSKPHFFYKLIENMMGDCSKIELFARHKREGWDVWGNQTPKETQNILSFTKYTILFCIIMGLIMFVAFHMK